MKIHWIWSIFIATIFLTACQPSPVPESTPLNLAPKPTATQQTGTIPREIAPPSPNPEIQPIDPMPRPNSTPDESSATLVTLARDNLSGVLGISAEQITLISVQATTWPDAGLGCPKLGVFYIQVLTSGYIIQLSANNKSFIYHTDSKERVILCKNLRFPDLPSTPEGTVDH